MTVIGKPRMIITTYELKMRVLTPLRLFKCPRYLLGNKRKLKTETGTAFQRILIFISTRTLGNPLSDHSLQLKSLFPIRLVRN